MEGYKFPFICYWGGEVVVDGDKVDYKGGKQDFLTVSKDISYNELVSSLFEIMELDVANFELEVKMKYPIVRGGFRVLPLKNNRGLESMWASVSQIQAPQLDLFIDIKPIEQQIITQNPCSFPTNTSFTSMLSNVERWVSLSSNNVDSEPFDDESESEDEDLMLLSELGDFDGNDDDDDDEGGLDLVSPSAPNKEFTKLYQIDEEHVNSWCGVNEVPYVEGGEFSKGQMFSSRAILADAVTTYHVSRNQVFVITESRSFTVTFKCGRKPKACTWCLRASKKGNVTEAFTIVTYVTDCMGAVCPICKIGMSTAVRWVRSPSSSVGVASTSSGFVKGIVTYMVMDNLEVKPMSTISGITLMSKFQVKDVSTLVEKEVQVGLKEGIAMLKASLETKAVLTSVFVGK